MGEVGRSLEAKPGPLRPLGWEAERSWQTVSTWRGPRPASLGQRWRATSARPGAGAQGAEHGVCAGKCSSSSRGRHKRQTAGPEAPWSASAAGSSRAQHVLGPALWALCQPQLGHLLQSLNLPMRFLKVSMTSAGGMTSWSHIPTAQEPESHRLCPSSQIA